MEAVNVNTPNTKEREHFEVTETARTLPSGSDRSMLNRLTDHVIAHPTRSLAACVVAGLVLGFWARR